MVDAVGATVGVGFLENTKNFSGINCKVFIKTAIGWLITCVIVGITAGLLSSQGAYSPVSNDWKDCNLNITN